MNSFTVEASFHGWLNPERTTIGFDSEALIEMGKKTCNVFLEYIHLLEEE
jgi:hypothetical protein